jgi:hypothetical protein
MLDRTQLAGIVFFATLSTIATAAHAFDEARYPDLRGAWVRTAPPDWVQRGEKPAPLTLEYQAIYDANLAAQALGDPGDAPQWYCLPQGMPMMMSAYDPMEIVVTADVTYVLISHVNDMYRRIYTDGRDWPNGAEPAYAGYSIGRWIDESGTGRFDVLEVETRNLKNPRTFDTTGLPLHKDAETIIKERIRLDKSDTNALYDEITVLDHALTEPWTVIKKYRRGPNLRPSWISNACAEGNAFVRIGNEAYYLSTGGLLMPIKKDQRPPDLRYFRKSTEK